MKKIVVVLLVLGSMAVSQHIIVRVYTSSQQDLKLITEKTLDIAAARAGQWYDIVADRAVMDRIINSGLTYEVRVLDTDYAKQNVMAQYHSYSEVTTILRNMASAYPSICKLDSLPLRTYQGRWLYGVKISDEPAIEDPNEPGLLVDALHHSREWASIELVLFFADSMLKSYGVVSQITNIINSTEIYCFPIINADGYAYDYPGQLLWRKNREPFGGATGCDPNRNYPACASILGGDWGAVDAAGGFNPKASHQPDDDLFCGAWPNSGDETRALTLYAKSHIINAYMTYHMYSELLMWGWCFTSNDIPDVTLCAQKGNYMASLISRLGGGTYTPGQVSEVLYYVSGGSIDWVYSWNHYVNGISNLSYTTEVGTDFYQPIGDVDNILRQNFKALKYLADFTDSIVLLCEGAVPPCQIYPRDTVDQNFTLAWHPINTFDNHPVRWELVELSNLSVRTDSLESGTTRWTMSGYTLSTTYSHSATHSFFSGNTSNINNAVQTVHPYLVQPGDSFSFWCRYALENNYDVTVPEISENTKEWFMVDTAARFTGTQSSFVRRAYSLANWVGKSVYFRFRTMYDGGTNSGGFYVDDIKPVPYFNSVTTVSNNITDTTYAFTNHALGEYYFYVRGNNTAWGWGDFSCLEKVVVSLIGVAEHKTPVQETHKTSLSITPNPFSRNLSINFESATQFGGRNPNPPHGLADAISLKIFDASGRLVKSFNHLSATYPPHSLADGGNCQSPINQVIWSGTDDTGRLVKAGVYFVRLESEGVTLTEKAILLR